MDLRLPLGLIEAREPTADDRLPQLPVRKRLLAWARSRTLDEQLAAGADPARDPLLAYRARKIGSQRFRHQLAVGFRDVVERAQHRHQFSAAAPVTRLSVLEQRGRLEELADRLDSGDTLGPRGVASAALLLTDGASPLWVGDPQELADAVEAAQVGFGC